MVLMGLLDLSGPSNAPPHIRPISVNLHCCDLEHSRFEFKKA